MKPNQALGPSMPAVLILACLLVAMQCRDRVSDRAKKALDLVAKFVEEECIP